MFASPGGALRVEPPRALRRPAAKSHRTACRRTEAAAITDMTAASTAYIYVINIGGDDEGTRVGGPPPSREGGREEGNPLGRRPGPRFHEVMYHHNVHPYTQPCGSAVARQMYC